MTQPTGQFSTYVLPRLRNGAPDRLQEVAPIDNLIYDELGQAVLAIHNERFRGVQDIEDKTNYKQNQPLAFSSVPRALSYHQILHQLTGGRIAVAGPVNVFRYWNDIPERETTYADTNAIALFPEKGDLVQEVLEILGKRSIYIPFLVAGLGVKKANSKNGFTFTESDILQATEAPYLAHDGKVRYDPATQSLVAATEDEEGVQIWVPEDQSGLHGAYRNRGCFLGCGNVRFLYSGADGRVQVVQKDPKGRAEK